MYFCLIISSFLKVTYLTVLSSPLKSSPTPECQLERQHLLIVCDPPLIKDHSLLLSQSLLQTRVLTCYFIQLCYKYLLRESLSFLILALIFLIKCQVPLDLHRPLNWSNVRCEFQLGNLFFRFLTLCMIISLT